MKTFNLLFVSLLMVFFSVACQSGKNDLSDEKPVFDNSKEPDPEILKQLKGTGWGVVDFTNLVDTLPANKVKFLEAIKEQAIGLPSLHLAKDGSITLGSNLDIYYTVSEDKNTDDPYLLFIRNN
jgi:hypothetical protein